MSREATKRLIIVESPGKIKKIQSFLSPNDLVTASVGHIRDIHSTRQHRFGIDIDSAFAPIYQVSPDRTDVIKKIRSQLKGRRIILAADMDREGEAIAESCRDVLNLRQGEYTRITFNEITRSAILKALEEPREIDQNLVEAQLCRRMLDRLVGFSLSPLLSRLKELPTVDWNLGSGRVQSIIVRLAVEREREIESEIETVSRFDSSANPFVCETFHRVPLSLPSVPSITEGTMNAFETVCTLKRDAVEATVETAERAEELAQAIISTRWRLSNLKFDRSVSNPSAPFTTSTLGSEAHNRFGWTMRQTMSIAQKLYERGFITYMRTDSPNLSEVALDECKNHILQQYGEQSYRRHQYTAKAANASEAHEGVRPTHISDRLPPALDTHDERRLYSLIWSRTVASQMTGAEYLTVTLTFAADSAGASDQHDNLQEYRSIGTLKFLISAGYLALDESKAGGVYDRATVEAALERLRESDNRHTGDDLTAQQTSLVKCELRQKIPTIRARFNEATMIRELERLEIGRPSTYASLLNRVKEHKYLEVKDVAGVDKEIITIIGDPSTEGASDAERDSGVSRIVTLKKIGTQKARLVPTETGTVVNDFLNTNFPAIVNYEFTKQMELDLDKISNGQISRQGVLSAFWAPFNQTVTEYRSRGGAPTSLVKGVDGINPSLWRRLQLDPIVDGEKTYIVYQGKTKIGKCLRLESSGSAPVFLNWREDEPPDSAQLQQLLERKSDTVVGDYQIRTGKYGQYIEHNGKKYSIKETTVPGTGEDNITLDTATIQSIIQERDKRDEGSRLVGKYKIARGPYGPYILVPPANSKARPKFVSIDPEYHDRLDQLTVEVVEKMIANKAKAPKPKAKAKTKASAKAKS